jgi:hypothetical protein
MLEDEPRAETGEFDAITLPSLDVLDVWRSRSPGSQTSQLTCDLISAFQVADLRYSIFAFALYFKDLPRRLGTNDALDAAVGAFLSAHQVLRSGLCTQSTLQQYGYALKVLRESLYDPSTAQSSETLCAVHLLWICQVSITLPRSDLQLTMLQPWIGFSERHNSHAAGVARILNYASAKDWKDPFRAELVFTITSIMVSNFEYCSRSHFHG